METWYRYEDVQYSTCDEFGVASGGHLVVELRTYQVLKHTPKGVWLSLAGGGFSCIQGGNKRFVLKDAHKKFACPTLELARKSFIARKQRQVQIHTARANQAKRAILLAESLK